MDAEFPPPFQPWIPPAEAPPEAPAPPRDPAWTGADVVIVILVSLLAIVAATLVAVVAWGMLVRLRAIPAGAGPELPLVAMSLLGQTVGLAAGFFFAWQWIGSVHAVRFWRSLHWNWLGTERLALLVLGGGATMIGVQLLSHLLPMPSEVPLDRLFTPQTAWLLVLYGVGVAPFFEEFIFRGLIYPSLRSTFAEGMNAEEMRAWWPLARVLGALVIAGAGYWGLSLRVISAPVGMAGGLLLYGGVAVGVLALALPGVPLAAIGWGCTRLATLRRPELLAILLTGTLFGMLHAAQLGWAWAAVLIMVLVGIVLTTVRAATGSLMASWVFHCAYNGALFAIQYAATQGFHHFPPGH